MTNRQKSVWRRGNSFVRQTGLRIPRLGAIFWLSIPSAQLLLPVTVRCQDAIRVSQANQAAAAQARAVDPSLYNVAIGPVGLRFQGQAGTELNDNVTYSKANPQEDLIFRAGLNTAVYWPVTEKQTLSFSVGIGYLKYLKTTQLDRLYITPDSALAFQMYAGDFTFDVHNRFTINESVTQSPSVSGTGDFSQLRNSLGTGVDWNLNKLIFSFGYDHEIVASTSGTFKYADLTSELFILRGGLQLNESTQAGLEAGGGLTSYDQQVLNDSTHFIVGPFYQAQITEYISGKVSGGFVKYSFTRNGTAADLDDVSGFYADVSLSHRLNQYFTQTLSGGRQFQPGITANLLDLYSVRYLANWNVSENVTLFTPLFYEQGKQLGGVVEKFDRYGTGLSAGYKLTPKLMARVAYDFLVRISDVRSREYTQNRLAFDVTYTY